MGQAGGAVTTAAGPGQADGLARGDRGAGRRLPRARRRDGDARAWPTSSTLDEGGSGLTVEAGPGTRADDCPAPSDNLVTPGPGGLRAHGRRPPDASASPGRRAGRRLGRRRRRAALGRVRRPGGGASVWVPTCPSAWSAGGPWSRARGAGHAAALRGPRLPAAAAALRRGHGRRSTRAWDDAATGPRSGANALTRGRTGGRAPAGPVARRPGRARRARADVGRERLDLVRRGRARPRRARHGAPALRIGARAGPPGAGPHGAGGLGWATEGSVTRATGLLAGPALPAGGLQHLLVLLLAHPLAALLDQ